MAGRADSLRRVEGEVGVLLRRARRAIAERARSVHPDLGSGAYLVLAHVVEHGPQRASDVACALTVDKGGMSRTVQHLVDLGLLERQVDPDDRRAHRLAATPDAARRLADVQRERSARFDARLGHWTDAQVAGFADLMAAYNEALGAD